METERGYHGIREKRGTAVYRLFPAPDTADLRIEAGNDGVKYHNCKEFDYFMFWY